nr:cytochrome P450 monooxygenase CYP345BA2 [Lasioderma serricorne]
MAILTKTWTFDLLLLTILLIYLLFKYSTRNFTYWKSRGIPYIPPIPIFGNTWQLFTFRKSIGIFFQELYNSVQAPFFGIFIFDKPALVVKDPDLIKSILVKDFSHFDSRTILDGKGIDPVVPHFIFFSKNPEWKHSRAKLTPIFTTGKLRAMAPLVHDVGERLLRCIGGYAESGASVDAKEVCSKFATDVTASCFFGINAKSFENEDAKFRIAAKKVFDFSWRNGINQSSYFFAHQLAKVFRMKAFDPEVVQFFFNVFNETIKRREKDGNSRNDLIDHIIKMKSAEDYYIKEFDMGGDNIVIHSIQFFVAGFETTSSTIAFTLHELALNEEIQDKLRREILQSTQKYNKIDYDALKEMKYLDQCVNETLRKYPVLPFLDRTCNTPYTIPGTNVVIEKGMSVYIPMFGTHYDPEFFPDPDKYDPDRFAGNYQETIKPYTYFPFGVGPRNCIGERLGLLNTKLAVPQIISNYRVIKSEKTVSPLIFEPKSFVLAAVGGVPLRFQKLIK